MLYVIYVTIGCFVAALPIKLTAWTCICGYSEEKSNPDLETMARNFRDFRDFDHFASYNGYVQFWNYLDYPAKNKEICWRVDERYKRRANNTFYSVYEFVHERKDSEKRHDVFQIFNILKYNDFLQIFRELQFDINWYFDWKISCHESSISKLEEELRTFYSRSSETLQLEDQIYSCAMELLKYKKSREYWLQKLQNLRKTNEILLLNIYVNCQQKHSNEFSRFQLGLRNFFKGKFHEAFDDIKQHAKDFIEKKVESVVGDTTTLLCGIIATEVEKYLFAESCYTCFLEKSPDYKEAYLERAIVRLELGDLSKALEDYLLSGLHEVLIHSQPEMERIRGLGEGIKLGFEEACEFDEVNPGLLPNFFTDELNAKMQHLTRGIKASLDFLSQFLQSIHSVQLHHSSEISEIQIPELVDLIQNYDVLEEFQKGKLIGATIKKYGISTFSKKSQALAIDFYRDIKKVNSLLRLANLLNSKTNLQ